MAAENDTSSNANQTSGQNDTAGQSGGGAAQDYALTFCVTRTIRDKALENVINIKDHFFFSA